MPAIHNDQENRLIQVYSSINRAEELGLLTDAGVAAADTKAGLKAFIDSIAGHNDQQNWKIDLKQAIDVSGLADADIAGLTTVAGLVALLGIPAVTTQHVLA